MKQHKEHIAAFDVVFRPDGELGYVVTVPKLPGLVTQGDTLQEARRMAKDAIRCYIEALLKDVRGVGGAHRRKRTVHSL